MRRFLFAVALVPPIALSAQTPTEIRLQPPTARLEEEFSDLVTMRELRDGRVLLFDRNEGRLLVADVTRGTTTNISRQGRGPGEFQLAFLYALGGDSTLAADMHRWLILDGAKVVATLPPDTPAIRAMHLWPLGADRQGHVLTRRFAPRGGDSVYVALVDRATGRTDTIASVAMSTRHGRVVVTRGSGGEVTSTSSYRIPLTAHEIPVLAPDGWVAVARLDPYRVDWRSPAGEWTHGTPLPVRTVRMTDRERRAFIERNRWAAGATDWPETLPPFAEWTELLASPDGLVLIRRIPSADQPETRYDMVDRRGALRGQLVLPPNQQLHGFGAQSVYVVTTDDDGIQRLTRHPWPSAVSPKR